LWHFPSEHACFGQGVKRKCPIVFVHDRARVLSVRS
jgi:hypothetical protein